MEGMRMPQALAYDDDKVGISSIVVDDEAVLSVSGGITVVGHLPKINSFVPCYNQYCFHCPK